LTKDKFRILQINIENYNFNLVSTVKSMKNLPTFLDFFTITIYKFQPFQLSEKITNYLFELRTTVHYPLDPLKIKKNGTTF